MRIAIITASIGNGHNAVAHTLLEALQQKTTDEVRVYDILDDSRVYQLISNFYLELVLKTPQLYHKLYQWSQNREKPHKIIGYLNFICLKYLKRIKKSFLPDLFIFTHPIPANSYSYSLGTPAWTVVTDYSYHNFWFNSKLTGYFVANNEVKKQIINNGYPANSVYVTGLPVKPSFVVENKDPVNLLNHSKNPLILVMGGGLGVGPLEEIINKIDTIDIPFEALVIAGKNHILFEKIKASFIERKKERWGVLEFTNEIPSLMKRASILISKAGGVTLTEALVSHLPTIIYKPLPGQEMENAQLASSQGWAIWAKESQELVDTTKGLLEDVNHYYAIKKNIQEFRMPNATDDIVDILFEFNTFMNNLALK